MRQRKKVAKAPRVESEVKAGPEYNDIASIALLFLLYTLQGIPMGLSSSIPFILQSKVAYTDLATFSLVSWPFSLKLLWAPIVDSVYFRTFGRRKSWLIPVQFSCALLMIGGGYLVGELLGEQEGQHPHVVYLTIYFFILYFMMATQDIAVDGWALTMLSPKNVGYASTCNSVGQTMGYFMSYVGFLALHDPDTCNTYFRTIPQDEGLVSLPQFLSFLGWVMLITTIGVMLFKAEHKEAEEHILSVRETYHQMYSVFCLPSVLSLTIILLTSKIGFAAAEAVAPLKLVEYGLAKEKLALLSPILIPLGIVIPIVLSKYSSGDKPWNLFLYGYPFRLIIGLLYAAIVYYTPTVMAQNEDFHYYYYGIILLSGALHELAANMMFVSVMSFFARISDPRIGGTYMTFLNTVTNMGSKWPNSLSLAFVDYFSVQECVTGDHVNSTLSCDTTALKEACLEAGGKCHVLQDGFFVETWICLGLGIVWLFVFYRRVQRIQQLKIEAWRVKL